MSMVLCVMKIKKKAEERIRKHHGRGRFLFYVVGWSKEKENGTFPSFKGTFQKLHTTLKAYCSKISHTATPCCKRRWEMQTSF